MLTVEDTAEHFDLTPGTIRNRIKRGELRAQRINRQYRLAWEDVWACEKGPMPKGQRLERYRKPLMSKSRVAEKLRVSVKTIERMIGGGLPTRNAFGSVRINPDDARDWIHAHLEFELAEEWYV
ncbi:helix-turn-helix domain-containing protein [Sedimentitalea nanhaiensis]|uniref:Helix-turn-helix domain-containing protein n=1 Tax=Sedimentitalea nanhaiensis TaxID=999627 RepID=A0A1I7A5A2_9RHOB|nr:helix-turn-helix domain-containing protein [Sedimentitalea nanhaiensis]SFT70111.1 Helix-turn-helix domain-containing protein [Sedimentitalea nanhaiensis]